MDPMGLGLGLLMKAPRKAKISSTLPDAPLMATTCPWPWHPLTLFRPCICVHKAYTPKMRFRILSVSH